MGSRVAPSRPSVAFSGLCAAGAVVASCSSFGSEPATDAGADAAVGEAASGDAAVVDAGFECPTLETPTSAVPSRYFGGKPPAAKGGELIAGTYTLKDYSNYAGAGTPQEYPGNPAVTHAGTLRIGLNSYAFLDVNVTPTGTTKEELAGILSISQNAMKWNEVCSRESPGEMVAYTSKPPTIILYRPIVSQSVGTYPVAAFTFVKTGP